VFSSCSPFPLQDPDDDDDSEDDDSAVNWGSDSDESSSDDDEDAGTQLKGRARWLKKTVVEGTKKIKGPKTRIQKDKEAILAARALEAMTARKSIIPEEGLTVSILNRKVQELALQRGRKGKDGRELLRELEALSRLSLQFGARVEIPILMYVISSQFGLQRTLDDTMDTPTWKACAGFLERIADIIDEGYTLKVEEVDPSDMMLSGTKKMKAAANAQDGAMAAVAADENFINPHTGEAETEDERLERLRLEAESKLSDEEKKVIPVVGSLALHMSRLEEEYTKSLQRATEHSSEYIARLRDESKLVELLARFQSYFEKQDMIPQAASLAQLRAEHLYYRHDSIAHQVDKAAAFYGKFGELSLLHPACFGTTELTTGADFTAVHPGSISGKPSLDDAPTEDFHSVVSDLCRYVYKHGTDQSKVRAIICHIYHHALHDRFMEARDLLLMSHIQDTIYDTEDVSTMIMYNRMMVNVGMCAFRLGRIYDAHQCLSDVCSGKVRELLAQGVSMGRYYEKTPEQEKAEKRRQVPFHQHINLELLEACHLISAMLLDVPNMAGEKTSRRTRLVSRTFRKYYDQYNHQIFTGPPEQTREFVMYATKCLLKGDWKTCAQLVSTLDVWNLVPGEGTPDAIGSMLTNKIKLEGLRTYLFAFSTQYDSLSLHQLCGMFEMSKSEVHSVVSKMMINEEIHASWDQPTETIVLRRVEPSPLQSLALQYAEKTRSLVESNERLLDAMTGQQNYKDDWKNENGDRWNNNRNFGKGNMRSNQRVGGNFQRSQGQRPGGRFAGRRPGANKARTTVRRF